MEGQISAKMILDSIDPRGNRLRTLEVVMPRYILAEFNTHRILGRNSASSRAIPLRKMLLEVIHRPFIPYAFQKDHKGMQGTEYFDPEELFSLAEFMNKAKDFIIGTKEDEESLDFYVNIINQYKHKKLTLQEWWLLARDKAVEMVTIFGIFGVTKQLANRLLEPFMYHKVLVSGTEWDNFFNLRCPQYNINGDIFKSKKDAIKKYPMDKDLTILEWLHCNNGQADIHMMFLAEAIWDATNESTPILRQEGGWHMPYSDQIELSSILRLHIEKGLLPQYENIDDYSDEEIESTMDMVRKISIARCARLSYQTLGDNPVIDYEKDLELYETLSTSGHWSPFEHVAKVMTKDEYSDYTKTTKEFDQEEAYFVGKKVYKGWCRNYRGFIQYRELLD